jgi:PPOX class probable F420-dependent enzyme
MTERILTEPPPTTHADRDRPAPSVPADAGSAGLQRLVELAGHEHHLGVLITLDEDGTPQVSVVNFGVVDDPRGRGPRVAVVARRGAKLRNLTRNPLATIVVRAGWEWIAVRGTAEVIDHDDELGAERVRTLLRDVYRSAGGHHDDLETYDEVMAVERRCAVLIRPERFTTNPAGAEHREPAS